MLLAEHKLNDAPIYVVVVFLVIGLMMLNVATRLVIKDIRFRRRARFVMATVVTVHDAEEVADQLAASIFRGNRYVPVMAFIGPDGLVHEVLVRRPTAPRPKIGSHLPIRYDPDDLSQVFLDGAAEVDATGLGILAVMGIVFVIASMSVLFNHLP